MTKASSEPRLSVARSSVDDADDTDEAGSAFAAPLGAVVDRYTVLERLGAGGMGEVYAAYDTKLDRKVALKVLRHESPEYEARLIREAQAMARLSHPNVVAVFDTGVVGKRLYLAMEFVRGVTLRAWQQVGGASKDEILRVYLEAGRGLAAAHAAGLVHRDFKPDNVLIAEDGRVKVTDFGIARAVEEGHAAPEASAPRPRASVPAPSLYGREQVPSTGGSLGSPMTQEGAMLGTPGYMAPEQYLAEAIDHRTDQFAFSVSLYEALYGKSPFFPEAGGERPSLQQIAEATLEGKIGDPPKGSGVPAHVRRALLRGLSAEREDRYPSMQALLEDLARDPERRRRRLFAAVAMAAATLGLAVIGVRAASARQASLCSATEGEVREVWNTETAGRAERALLATGVPYAADVWSRTKGQLDDYMRSWGTMHRETCAATRIHGHQAESVMALRMSCLEQRKNEVRALLQVLATADPKVASRALQSAMELTRVDVCKDVAALTAMTPEPTAPDKREGLHVVRLGIASVRQNLSAGRFALARDEATPLLAKAKDLGYAPALADVLLLSARAKARTGARREVCIDEAMEAVLEADAGRTDAIRAEAAIWIGRWLTDAGNHVEADRWLRAADGALRRTADRGILRAEWLRAMRHALETRGQVVEGAARIREALEVAKAAGASLQDVADLQMAVATAEGKLGHNEEATRLAKEADELFVRVMGEEHPARIEELFWYTYVSGAAGDQKGALEHARRAIGIAERVAPDHDNLAVLYNNACSTENRVKDHASALATCEKGLSAAVRVYGPDSFIVAYVHTNLGNALVGLGRYDDALGHYERAVAIHERTGTEKEENCVESLGGVGKAKLLGGDAKGAVAPLERALSLAAALPGRSSDVGLIVADVRSTLDKAHAALRAR